MGSFSDENLYYQKQLLYTYQAYPCATTKGSEEKTNREEQGFNGNIEDIVTILGESPLKQYVLSFKQIPHFP